MKRYSTLFFLCSWVMAMNAQVQGYTHWLTGDTTDVSPTNFQSGIVLAGGGTDNDDAMKWMLSRADGGDVVVIRASNSNRNRMRKRTDFRNRHPKQGSKPYGHPQSKQSLLVNREWTKRYHQNEPF